MTEFKVIILGETGVGKTSVSLFASEGTKVSDSSGPEVTLATDYKSVEITVGGRQIVLHLWDTAGQERHAGALTSSFYRNSDGCLLVAARGEEESVESLSGWHSEVTRFSMATFDPVFAILQNKSDTDGESYAERTAQLADEWECKYFESSAKTGEGIMEALEYLASKLVVRKSADDLEARSPSAMDLKADAGADGKGEERSGRRGCNLY